MNIILIGFGHICKSAYLPWTISNQLVEKFISMMHLLVKKKFLKIYPLNLLTLT